MKTARARIFTVGHSNRSLDELVEIIESQRLKLLIDVRRVPKSRHNPHFAGTRLAKSLAKRGIDYVYLPGLAGFRRSSADSPNMAWRNKSFRAYADYMQTPEFEKALKRLISLSKRKRLVIMCAEAVPWRCHRSLIADALLGRKLKVDDLYSKTSARPHKLPSFARVRGGRVSYPLETH